MHFALKEGKEKRDKRYNEVNDDLAGFDDDIKAIDLMMRNH